MRIIGNLLWWLFGGLEAAIGYFSGSLALACTIIGIPFALQTFKIGLLCRHSLGKTAFQDGRAFARTIRQGCGVGILKRYRLR